MAPTPPAEPQRPARPARARRSPWVALALLLLVAVAVAAVLVWRGRRLTVEDAVIANTRGVGHMEQFDGGYPLAVKEFERAVRAAPGWNVPKVNLGIALLNTQQPENLARAIGLFEEVLAAEPDNPHAHYSLAMILLYLNRLPEAAAHYEAVTRIDPNDAHAWYHRGMTHPDKDDSPEAKGFFERAVALNPYLNAARYALALHGHERDPAKTLKMLDEKNRLFDATWESEYRLVYTEMGRYAEVIGKPLTARPRPEPLPMFARWEAFNAALAPGKTWDLPAPPVGDDSAAFLDAVRARFGQTVVLLDYDGDKKTDILLLAAVGGGPRARDVLLRNEGNGAFRDVTAEAGLPDTSSTGAAVADFNNDGLPDLVLTGPTGVRLFVQSAPGRFRDDTAAAGFDTLRGAFLGVTPADLDQDGDLDLLVARYATTAAEGLASLKGLPAAKGEVVVLLNVGVALAGETKLTTKFQRGEGLGDLSATRGAVVGFLVSDLDGDRDLDVVTFRDHDSPVTTLNDRLLRFHRGEDLASGPGRWLGGLVLSANDDEQSDLLLLADGAKARLKLSASDAPAVTLAGRFAEGRVDTVLRSAVAIDLDLDSHTDVLGVSGAGKLAVLQGDGQGNFVAPAAPLGPEVEALAVTGLAAADFDNDCAPDVLVTVVGKAPAVYRNLGTRNKALHVELSGRRDPGSSLRTNADGIGAWVAASRGALRSSQENTTAAAGLGQSRLPILLGLGGATSADVLRIRWPDGVPQAELNLPACELAGVVELNRKGTSCPILHTWDGERFAYVTDFLGGGALGEAGPDGAIRPARPQEALTIPAGKLAPRAGKFVVKVSEPMDEVLYLDALRLDVVDHPAGGEVFADERFSVGGPPVTGALQRFGKLLAPTRAVDHAGRDVLATVTHADGKRVEGFALRHWLGYAEEHSVEFEFPALPKAPGVAPGVPTLVLAGWLDYPYPESIFAATQAGVPTLWPVLEEWTAAGWVHLADLGIPAGLPKTMTRPLPELAGRAPGRLRIRSNVQVYWDRIALGVPEAVPATRSLPVSRATLAHRGFLQEVTPARGSRQPVEYREDRLELVSVTKWLGRLTRTGDVTPLLAAADDRFVLCGPGDEVTAEFDADLPPPPAGFVRTFVLRADGYCKDTSPFTKTGGQVGPLPYRGMASYPDGATAPPAAQAEYDRRWNTRAAGR